MGHPINRREFLGASGAFAARAVVGSSLFTLGCDFTFFGPLQPPDGNGIRLPPGFHSRVLAISGSTVPGTGYRWHGAPDGGAVFDTTEGWIYVSNSERSNGGGGSALLFDDTAEVLDAYPICIGTRRNCAGGATPWGTWLSCEEVSRGLVYECDPFGLVAAAPRRPLGTFNHEAVAVDPHDRRLYLTEDRSDGRLYRFTPNAWENLTSGVLEVARVTATGQVHWHIVPNPNPVVGQVSTRHQVPVSTPFNGGEGIDYSDGHVYFVTKGDDRVWDLDVSAETIHILYDKTTDPIKQLSGVDNLTTTPRGEILVAEDGGNMELVMLLPDRPPLALLRVEGQAFSELTGPAFDPSGRRLYFSSQRGFDGRGITYEISGPFHSQRHRS